MANRRHRQTVKMEVRRPAVITELAHAPSNLGPARLMCVEECCGCAVSAISLFSDKMTYRLDGLADSACSRSARDSNNEHADHGRRNSGNAAPLATRRLCCANPRARVRCCPQRGERTPQSILWVYSSEARLWNRLEARPRPPAILAILSFCFGSLEYSRSLECRTVLDDLRPQGARAGLIKGLNCDRGMNGR